uniref:dnaJ homolog subfamily C member 7-like n=1 Tax=Erigeron canadensis TaxID=72917 RepID=UPI001CB9A924|nr:dnaJ homolog subfamily C member 7-like [Erigeron canadensis]
MANVNSSRLPPAAVAATDDDDDHDRNRPGASRGRGDQKKSKKKDKCCYRCNQPGHSIRDCPLPDDAIHAIAGRSNQASVNSSSKVDKREVASVTPKVTELPSKNVDLTQLLTNKEKELQSCRQEIESLKSQLNKATTELDSFQAKNKEMILKMNKIQSRLNERTRELTEELSTVSDNVIVVKREEWSKAAKAVASVFVGGADLCSKKPELVPLILLYSSRADKRISNGKLRKAIDDCRIVTGLEPDLLSFYVRAGNCHLVLGEIDDAQKSYRKCLDSGWVWPEFSNEASDGLQNAEKVSRYINQSAELLKNKTVDSAANALEVITKALSISYYSEKLLEMKGEALFMLHKYEEAIEMCEQTLVIAEKNCNHMSDEDKKLKLWRWSLMSRSYFRMAKFELALSILEQYEQLGLPETKTVGSSSPSVASLLELFRCKSAGNQAFKDGKYREAVEHYTNAITRCVESRHFTAICLCNRAAAHQALGEVIDAIADCNLAIALDGDYAKAIYRRANLYEKIRDHLYEADDYTRLVSLLEKRSEKKDVEYLTIARQRLSFMPIKLINARPVDHYLVLGLKGSESGAEIKKAYHKALLKHHPDQAGKFLTRSESGVEDHVWKEIFRNIHEEAEKLFENIDYAYDVLSDDRKLADWFRNMHREE